MKATIQVSLTTLVAPAFVNVCKGCSMRPTYTHRWRISSVLLIAATSLTAKHDCWKIACARKAVCKVNERGSNTKKLYYVRCYVFHVLWRCNLFSAANPQAYYALYTLIIQYWHFSWVCAVYVSTAKGCGLHCCPNWAMFIDFKNIQ